MQSLTAAVAQPREQAIRNGLLIQGRRYEVCVDGTMIQSIALSKGGWNQQAGHLLCACLTVSILPGHGSCPAGRVLSPWSACDIPFARRRQVHQHHPPLVWGRSMQGDPESSTGAAVYQGMISGTPVYVAVTFE